MDPSTVNIRTNPLNEMSKPIKITASGSEPNHNYTTLQIQVENHPDYDPSLPHQGLLALLNAIQGPITRITCSNSAKVARMLQAWGEILLWESEGKLVARPLAVYRGQGYSRKILTEEAIYEIVDDRKYEEYWSEIEEAIREHNEWTLAGSDYSYDMLDLEGGEEYDPYRPDVYAR
ncbi:hypothetical protein BJ508DRAFT_329338 [Ascobolus immersus RN42]|uniref:Uncharacterized protein n=1 Tax=Ascobolus immersus RN42 TaxID=1160509 RepID=A0A3N4I120_ASCIM|nr:hypothetical protein BJ508DRAFT_329338 [Ascobolus immersus RN42]